MRPIRLLPLTLLSFTAPLTAQGMTWQPVGGGDYTSFVVSPDYAQDGSVWAAYTVFPTTSQTHVDRSTDFGATFQVQSQIANSVHIKELAISPTFASDQTLYQAHFRTGLVTDELLRSTDGGATWSSANLPNAGILGVTRLSPNHANDQTLFAARLTFDRTYRSSNGGQSWTVPTQSGLPIDTSGDIEFSRDFAASQVVHMWNRYGSMSRSTNGGLTFSTSPTTCAMYSPHDVEAAPIGPGTQRIVFAAGQGGSPITPEPGIYRSVDDGLSYAPSDAGIPIGTTVFRVEASPDFATSGRVYAATGAGVYLSDDHGVTWAPLPAIGLPSIPVVDVQLAGGPDGDLYARVATAPNAPGQIYRLRLSGTGFVDLGHALAGANGAPTLRGDVAFAAQTAFTLRVDDALPNGLGLFALGLQRVDVPFAGGLVVPDPLILLPVLTDANGTAGVGLQWLATDPAGTTAFAQTWLLDTAGPAGFAASNALQLMRL